MENPPTLVLDETGTEEVVARGAVLHLSVQGSSLAMGNSAFKKARELNALTLALNGVGVQPEAIRLVGVHMRSEKGLLGSSSSASYQITATVDALDRLPDVLQAVGGQKGVTLDRLEWKYDDDEGAYPASLLARLLQRALDKARTMAAAAGMDVLRVEKVAAIHPGRPDGYDPYEHLGAPGSSLGGSSQMRRSGAAINAESMTLAMAKEVSATVRVTVQLGPRRAG